MSTIFKWDEGDMDALLKTCETDGIFPYIEKYMPAPARVLESGCGAGRYVKYLADRGWDVIGLEWDQDAVDMIKRYWPEVKAVQGDSANSPFPDNHFDGIISLGVIEHWIDGPEAPLKDLYRTLKPGGTAIITAPCLNTVRRIKKATWWNEYMNSKQATRNWRKNNGMAPNRLDPQYKYFPYPTYGEFFEYRFTKKQFIDAIKQEGLEIIEHNPTYILDGMYHELNPQQRLVKYEDREFKPTRSAKAINATLALIPFFHSHHQLAIVRKPETANKKSVPKRAPIASKKTASKTKAKKKTATKKTK